VVLLDTNALFLPFRAGLPLVDEVARWWPGTPIAVAGPVLRELDRLVERRAPQAAAARAFARGFRAVPGDGRGDAALLRVALSLAAPVVTADRALAVRLRAAGLPVLVPRDRTRLELRPGRPPRVTGAGAGASRGLQRRRARGTVKSRARLERGDHA
jgi:rRNA-processing protein FCF1